MNSWSVMNANLVVVEMDFSSWISPFCETLEQFPWRRVDREVFLFDGNMNIMDCVIKVLHRWSSNKLIINPINNRGLVLVEY